MTIKFILHKKSTKHFKTASELKPGYKVKIRRDLRFGKCGNDAVVFGMEKMRGYLVTIKEVNPDRNKFLINEFGLNWTPEMTTGLIYF